MIQPFILKVLAPAPAFIPCKNAQVPQTGDDNHWGCPLLRWPLSPSCLWAWPIHWWLSQTDGTCLCHSELVPKVSIWSFVHPMYNSYHFHADAQHLWMTLMVVNTPLAPRRTYWNHLSWVRVRATMGWIWSCWRHHCQCSSSSSCTLNLIFILAIYFPWANIHELLSPNLLHQLIKGTFKDHLVTWIIKYSRNSHNR